MVIPDDWQEVRLGDIGRLRGGVGFPLRFQGRKTAAIPFYKVSDMNLPGNDIFMRDSNNWVSEADCRALGAAPLPVGSIVFAKVGAAVFLERKRILTRPSCVDNNMMALIPEVGRCDTRFLHFALQQVRFGDLVSATALPSINGSGVAGIVIPLPPRREQEAIAEALGDADAAIEALDALIAKKRDVKQAAMQQLLTGRTRLPGFSGEWRECRLGDLGRCLRGVSYDPRNDLSASDSATTVRLLRSNNVQQSLVGFDDVQFVSEARVSDEQILRPGDIVVCMANGSKALVGKSGVFRRVETQRYTFGAFMGCFRTDRSKAAPLFVRYLFLTKAYQDYINNLLAGSAINNLAPSSIESLKFSVPHENEQAAIAEVLSDMDADLEALVAERDKMRLVKQGMMQELLSGRVRLV